MLFNLRKRNSSRVYHFDLERHWKDHKAHNNHLKYNTEHFFTLLIAVLFCVHRKQPYKKIRTRYQAPSTKQSHAKYQRDSGPWVSPREIGVTDTWHTLTPPHAFSSYSSCPHGNKSESDHEIQAPRGLCVYVTCVYVCVCAAYAWLPFHKGQSLLSSWQTSCCHSHQSKINTDGHLCQKFFISNSVQTYQSYQA